MNVRNVLSITIVKYIFAIVIYYGKTYPVHQALDFLTETCLKVTTIACLNQ